MNLYRLQDPAGRGPFRPGFSQVWQDAVGNDFPAIYQELGIPPRDLIKLVPKDMACGCACCSREQLRLWFSRAEERRLRRYGFSVVTFEPDLVIAETDIQVLFAMHRPLSLLSTSEFAHA